MVENKSKKAGEKDGNNKEQNTTEKEKDKGSKSGDSFNTSFSDFKEDKVLPFFEAGEEEFLKSHGLKDHNLDEDGVPKATLTCRDIFGKWGDEPKYSTTYPSFKEKIRRDIEEDDSVEHMEEELYRSRKHSKKEEKSKKKEKKDKEKSRRSPSPRASREKERPLFPAAAAAAAHQQSPLHHLSSTREEFELKITSLEDMPR